MTIQQMEEGHPIYDAIDRGGGQTCDIKGVIRELNKAGYSIVPKEPTEAMLQAAFNDGWVATMTDPEDFARWYKAMIGASDGELIAPAKER